MFVVYVSLHRTYVPCFFFFNDTATTEIYTLSLHDALPISANNFGVQAIGQLGPLELRGIFAQQKGNVVKDRVYTVGRSEEHTSELQSQSNLVCRLLLENKKSCPGRTPSASNTRPSATVSVP